MTQWVYIFSGDPRDPLWTVGFYDPSGKWHSDSDHASSEEAAERVHWLNGGGGNRFQRSERRDRNADRIDGYDRDDLGESPDF